MGCSINILSYNSIGRRISEPFGNDSSSRIGENILMRNEPPLHTPRSKPSCYSSNSCFLIIIFGGIGVYLAEHKHQGANITNLGDAFWWAIVTITTVGYGEYFPLTLVGRLIAVLVMFSGIGIVVTIVGIISQRRIPARIFIIIFDILQQLLFCRVSNDPLLPV